MVNLSFDANIWIGWPPSPQYSMNIGVLEGINQVMANLVERGFKGIVIGPWSAVENPKGKMEYGPFDSETYRKSLRAGVGSKVIKTDWYHAFNPTPKYYEATNLKPRYLPEKIENLGRKYFKEIVKAASDCGLNIYYLWLLDSKLEQPVPDNSQETADVFGRKMGWSCMNDPGLPEYMKGYLKDILDNYPEINGVILDSLGFASFEADEIFTCFCDVCRDKAESYGYNFSDLKLAALRFRSWLRDEKNIKQISENGISSIDYVAKIFSDKDFVDWLQFKFKSTNDIARSIHEVVQEVDPLLKLHIICMNPSFAPISGVDILNLKKYCDILTPKLYPTEDYWCWRHRLDSYVEFIRGGSGVDESTAIKFLSELFNLEWLSKYQSINELKSKVMPVEAFENEVKKLIDLFGDKSRIRPWIWLDYALTDEIKNVLKAVAGAGLKGAFFKRYSGATEEKLDMIQKEFGMKTEEKSHV